MFIEIGYQEVFKHGTKAERQFRLMMIYLRRNKDNRDVRKISSPRKKLRRKKLRKRIRSDPLTMQFHYTPTEEGISQLLKIFTVDFMLNGNIKLKYPGYFGFR